MSQRWGVLIAVALTACSGSGGTAKPAADTVAAATLPAPELALSAPQGVEVWFTDSRQARDSAGQACTERVMQIRREGQTIAIPLLYTGVAPHLVNDSTIEAAIWLHCRPGNVYQVSLRTGHPERVK